MQFGPHHGNYGRDRAIKATVSPSILDLSWAAGFLEGEGSFKTNGTKRPSQQVQAAQVQIEPLQRLQRFFGGKITFCRQARPEQQPIGKWGISGARARGVMLTLFSFMSPRRKGQILEALNAFGK